MIRFTRRVVAAVAMATALGAGTSISSVTAPARIDVPRAGISRASLSPDEEIERHFDFRSARLVNLHHFLLQQAVYDAPVFLRGQTPPRHAPVDTSSWAQAEKDAWEAARVYYRENLLGRSSLFDDEMRGIRDALAEAVSRSIAVANPILDAEAPFAEFTKDLASFDAIDDEHARVLTGADAVYRKRLWPDHDAQNRAWVAEIRPRLRTVIDTLPKRLVEVYGVAWPMEPTPIRVDVSVDAGWAGAYTTTDPPHICISSKDRRHEGWLAIEILFHEASHVLCSEVSREIREARGRRSKVPRDLWHIVLFYTTGELVRPYAGEAFATYAEANGMYGRVQQWAPCRDAIRIEWQPYLDGNTTRTEAITKLVERLREE